MFGPESTGKTTLAIQPDHYKTAWVPNLQGTICKKNGMKSSKFAILMICCPLLTVKLNWKNHGQSVADKYLFYDTNLMVTKVSQVYYNYCDPALDKAART
jgi:nicotinamide riboside kinase